MPAGGVVPVAPGILTMVGRGLGPPGCLPFCFPLFFLLDLLLLTLPVVGLVGIVVVVV